MCFTPPSAPASHRGVSFSTLWRRHNEIIAAASVLGIALSLGFGTPLPLFVVLAIGGGPQLWELAKQIKAREAGADLLAGLSIVTSLWLGEYLAGALVVLMISGGRALELYATDNASSALRALAKRIPLVAHRKSGPQILDVPVAQLKIDDLVVIYPHEACPVDGVVSEGHGHMDESYLTGEPFQIAKTVGSTVLSGALNGESALTVQATHLPADSRYAKIMQVMRESEQNRPHIRRLGDQLGAYYTPLALIIAGLAWALSGESVRFLAVLVVATPCPLLIGIPIAILGSISLAAKRAIIVKNPSALEQVGQCRTALFDKTGTLTYGEPTLAAFDTTPAWTSDRALALVAALEHYSKHPLAGALIRAAEARRLPLPEVAEVHETPGLGLVGVVEGHRLLITSRKKLMLDNPTEAARIPPTQSGLECVVVIDDVYAGLLRFHDAPRPDSRSFVSHLGPQHSFDKIMIISGDRESEVRYLADEVGIKEIHASQTPEEKLALVRAETAKARTLYVGDGINDAPAMMAATVGIAMGRNSEVTSEAAAVVILDNSLKKVDEFIHISRRLRRIALQSAVGGMGLSVIAMGFAAFGHLTPVRGALVQEAIDVLAILNALRVARQPRELSDFH